MQVGGREKLDEIYFVQKASGTEPASMPNLTCVDSVIQPLQLAYWATMCLATLGLACSNWVLSALALKNLIMRHAAHHHSSAEQVKLGQGSFGTVWRAKNRKSGITDPASAVSVGRAFGCSRSP